MLVAPWCLVLLLAIGCSKQKSRVSLEQGDVPERKKISAFDARGVDPATGTRPDHDEELSSEERYSAIIQSEADPLSRSKKLQAFYRDWGTRHGEAAVLHSMKQHRALVQFAFGGWLGADGDAPREWVLSQEGSERRRAGLAAGLLHALPATDHQLRSEWVEHFVDSDSGTRLVSEVAIGWGQAEPQRALDWLSALPEGRARNGGIETVFQRWTQNDPEVASTHLTRMAEGGAKDLAISSLAKAIYRDDPEAARLWADTIGDVSLRQLTTSLLDKLGARRGELSPEL